MMGGWAIHAGNATTVGEEKMTISFPFKFVDLGNPLPFTIEANPDFPTETKPLCILNNLGVPPAPDTFITVGPGIAPNAPDPWELTFHWATVGGAAAGAWQLDAFLESVSGPGPNVTVPGFPNVFASVTPAKHALSFLVPPAGFVVPAPGVFLYRLYATLRWAIAGPIVRVAGRLEGPLIEFYQPA
jgi:hypothetical protein